MQTSNRPTSRPTGLRAADAAKPSFSRAGQPAVEADMPPRWLRLSAVVGLTAEGLSLSLARRWPCFAVSFDRRRSRTSASRSAGGSDCAEAVKTYHAVHVRAPRRANHLYVVRMLMPAAAPAFAAIQRCFLARSTSRARLAGRFRARLGSFRGDSSKDLAVDPSRDPRRRVPGRDGRAPWVGHRARPV